MYNMYNSQLGSPTTSLLLLIFPAALRRLLLILLLLLLEAIHLQSKFVLERLYKISLLLLVVFGVWVVLGEAGTTTDWLVKF
jgi:ABC-type nickel/cobalt efflux system permease component RcnA